MTRSGRLLRWLESASYQRLITHARVVVAAPAAATAVLPFLPLLFSIYLALLANCTHKSHPLCVFVQKRKKLNDNLLWRQTQSEGTRRDAVEGGSGSGSRVVTLALSLAHVVRCLVCLFFFSTLLCSLLHNAMLHGAHFTHFNHKCTSFFDLFQFISHCCDSKPVILPFGYILASSLHASPAWARISFLFLFSLVVSAHQISTLSSTFSE